MDLKHYEIFKKYTIERLLLKYKIVLKDVPSSKTRVNFKWVKELWQKKAIEL